MRLIKKCELPITKKYKWEKLGTAPQYVILNSDDHEFYHYFSYDKHNLVPYLYHYQKNYMVEGITINVK